MRRIAFAIFVFSLLGSPVMGAGAISPNSGEALSDSACEKALKKSEFSAAIHELIHAEIQLVKWQASGEQSEAFMKAVSFDVQEKKEELIKKLGQPTFNSIYSRLYKEVAQDVSAQNLVLEQAKALEKKEESKILPARLIFEKDILGRKANGIDISPDGERLSIGSFDGKVYVYSLATQTLVFPAKVVHKKWIQVTRFNSRGDLLLTGGADHKVVLIDAMTGAEVKKFEGQLGHQGPLQSMEFSSDSQFFVTSALDNTIKKWDLKADRPIRSVEAPVDTWPHATIHPNGSEILYFGHSRSGVFRLDAITAIAKLPIETGQARVTGACYLPDGNQILWSTSGGEIVLWDILDSAAHYKFATEAALPAVSHLACSSDGRFAVAVYADDSIRRWDLTSGEFTLLEGARSKVSSLAISASGNRVAVAAGPTAYVWELK